MGEQCRVAETLSFSFIFPAEQEQQERESKENATQAKSQVWTFLL